MVQPIPNTQYGLLNFEKIYYGMSSEKYGTQGGAIGMLTNGEYVYFASGHPIEHEADGIRILEEVNPAAVKLFRDWWRRKTEREAMGDEPAPRAITFTSDGRVVFEDDKNQEVLKYEDVHAYFQPGVLRDMALNLFAQAEAQRKESTRLNQSKRSDPAQMHTPPSDEEGGVPPNPEDVFDMVSKSQTKK